MKTINPFPEPIWKSKFPGRLDSIIKRCEKYKNDKAVVTHQLGGKALQRYNVNDMPHGWDELEEFNIWLGPFIAKVWENWNYSLNEWQELSFRSWVNYSNTGQFCGEHNHSADVLTIVFYLNKSIGDAELQVLNPMVFHWGNTPQGENFITWKDISAETNEVVIIPGWMLHRVDINESKEERLSITINASIITKEKQE